MGEATARIQDHPETRVVGTEPPPPAAVVVTVTRVVVAREVVRVLVPVAIGAVEVETVLLDEVVGVLDPGIH